MLDNSLLSRLRLPKKIDVIYIDPPYNVGGNQGYRNIWKGESIEKNYSWAGNYGAFLDFLEPRLTAAKNLLSENGVMFVSICDGEYCRLKILMDEIFGESNCLGTIIWDKTSGAYGRHLTVIHEYILVYAKDSCHADRLVRKKESADLMIAKALSFKESKTPYASAQKQFRLWVKEGLNSGLIGKSEASYCHLHPQSYMPFEPKDMGAQDNPEKRYREPLIHPVTELPCSVPPKGWRWSEPTFIKRTSKGKTYNGGNFYVNDNVKYGKDESSIPRQVYPLTEARLHALPSVISIPLNQGKKDLPPNIQFPTPKPVELIKILLRSFHDKNAVVLDFFCGSGTTAQAVHELNSEDKGKRRWILVEEIKKTVKSIVMPRIKQFDSTCNYKFVDMGQIVKYPNSRG